ncbi:MAG: outer membrane beta-barrel protein [Chitinophagaceae bacterium]
MKRISILITSLLLFSFSCFSQGSISGTVVDTATKKFLPNATISVVTAKDSSLVTFARSNSQGLFSVSKLENDSYLLMVSYTGFGTFSKAFTISTANKDADMGIIPMTSNADLGAVIVTAAPVSIKGDTIEYNAGSFKTKPNANVEELLKKLPGVTVDKDGTIKSNGQEVKKIMVDGKQFFADDPKLASKNLQADMVNKVQVYDKKSDKSEFTGFDDGNSEPTINLTLKADKRVGLFGKVSGGYGTRDRYDGSANLNSFKKGEQISFIGQLNNINKQGFGLNDYLNGGGAFGGSSQGITTTRAAGLNYNNFKNKNLDFTSSYFFNNTSLKNDYNTYAQTTISDSIQFKTQPGTTVRENNNHRINLGIDWKIDSSNSIKITPSITFQNTQTDSHYDFTTLGPKGTLLSEGLNTTINNSSGYNFNTTALLKHKFELKGRTISAELKVGKNVSNGDGNQYSINNTYVGFSRRDTINRYNTSENNSNSYSVNVSYTEPMSKRSILEFNAYRNQNSSNSDRRTFNYNKSTGKYDIANVGLSNIFNNDFINTGAGINYRENRKTWNYAFGVAVQQAELSSLLQGKTAPISQKFLNFLPNAQIQIKPNSYKNFRLNYRGSNNQPSVSQLQPFIDSTNINAIKVGNPNLKQEFTNNLRVNYNIFDPYTQKSFFISINGSQTFNKIVNNDSLFSNGNRKTTYNNVKGVYNLNANMANGFPVKIAKIKANLNLNTNASLSHNINILNNAQNKIDNYSVGEKVSFNYTYKELFDIGFGAGLNWNKVTYSTQPVQNSNYFTQNYSIDNNWYIPGNFTLTNEVDYTINTGRAAGFNPKITLWNASLAKGILKDKKGELKLSVYDLLNQNKGVSRNTTSNYIEDQTYSVLKRYLMLSFTYNLSKFGAGGMPGGMRMMHMGGGRGGM